MNLFQIELRKFVAEALGTALLVFVGVGVATLSFGFKLTGTSVYAGVAATALAFGFVLLALAYTLGPISGAHVNPAVTLGFVLGGRMRWREAGPFWVAQFLGGIIGALVLYAIVSGAPSYSRAHTGLGADGWGPGVSMTGIGLGSALLTEVVLTFVFVLVVLIATSRIADGGSAGIAIGLGLCVVHLVGIPLTGTSVNPARSLGPALILGGHALNQVWLFIVAPLIGGGLAGGAVRLLIPEAGHPMPPNTQVAPASGEV